MRSLLGFTAAMILLAGCGSVAGVCAPIAPREFPDGSAPGALLTLPEGDRSSLWTWAGGEAQVLQAAGRPGTAGWPSCPPGQITASGECRPHGDVNATVHGHPAFVSAVGNEVESQVTIAWVEDGCSYMTAVGPGLTIEQVIAYAARY